MVDWRMAGAVAYGWVVDDWCVVALAKEVTMHVHDMILSNACHGRARRLPDSWLPGSEADHLAVKRVTPRQNTALRYSFSGMA